MFLGEVEGTFGNGRRAPERSLFVSAGSGITPIFSLLRSLDRVDGLGDAVHLYCMRDSGDFIFESLLRELERRRPGYRLHVRESSREGRLTCPSSRSWTRTPPSS